MTEDHEDAAAHVAVADKRSTPAQCGVPAVFMRGGTSKGLFFHERDLPPAGPTRDELFLEVMGSPDPLQIDGLGGSHSSSSKVVVVAPSDRDDADVEYLFVQVGIDRSFVSYDGNCGNLTSAVGPFAVDEGLVPVTEPTTTVRMWNRNTRKIIHAHVPIVGGVAAVTGDEMIAGVDRPGAAIVNEYRSPGRSTFDALHPTGSPADEWDVAGLGTVQVTILDVAHPYLYVSAAALGLTGTESSTALNEDAALLGRLEVLRGTAAVRLGLADTVEEATEKVPALPRIAMVAAADDYVTTAGQHVAAEEVDILVRMVSMGRAHHACPVTGVANLAAACLLPGTVPAMAVRRQVEVPQIRIGHPKGVSSAGAKIVSTPDGLDVDAVTLVRTARRLMDGTLYHRLRPPVRIG